MDFSSIEAATYGDVENDEELMAELLALEADEKAKAAHTRASAPAPSTRQIPHQQRAPPAADVKGRPPGGVQLSPQILSEVVKDIPDDDLLTDDDDIDDPELLNELSNLVDEEGEEVAATKTPVSQQSTISVDSAMVQRLQQLNTDYIAAVKTANAEGNSAKARRYQRAVDKIQELLKKVQLGKSIDESEIPVAIRGPTVPAVTKLPPPPVPQRPSITSAGAFDSNSVNPPAVPPHKVPTSDLNELKDKAVMLEDKSVSADKSGAPPVVSREGSHKLNVEQIKSLLRSRREAYVQNAQLANSAGDKTAAYEYYTVAKQFDEAITAVNNGEVIECDESELPPAPVPYQPKKKETVPMAPKTLMEGLQQRLEKYKSMCDQSRQENNDRKYRMNSRIVKQYEEAIRAVRVNRPIDITELPCPPGYPPLPTAAGNASTKPKPPPHPTAIGGAMTPSAASVARMRQANEVGPLAPVATPMAGQLPQSRQSQQLDFLLKRQLLFKHAALDARKRGDIQTAKKYLISAKGFDQMIQASRSGLPVDIKKAPIPPQLQTSTEALKPALGAQKSLDVDQIIEGSPEEVFAAMERDLIRQVKLCEENRLAFTKLGDVTRVKLFEQWSSNSKRDLILLRQVAKNGSSVPRFHYETRQFPSVDVCADINEDHLELQIVRVVNAKLPSGWQPSDGNIFVKYEFAFPHESHQSGKTKLVAGTNSPEFNEKILLSIKRQSKQLLRIVKRNCLKFEVYQKGGFLRSDKLLGTADCKLALLEEKAHIHESVDLMEGRRPAGGKIEFKVRIREPLGEKKLSLQNEKWLILDT